MSNDLLLYSGTTRLGNLELQALQVILSENIIMELKKEGLSFEHLDEKYITIEEIEYCLKRKGYIREAQQLKSELQSSKLSLIALHVDNNQYMLTVFACCTFIALISNPTHDLKIMLNMHKLAF